MADREALSRTISEAVSRAVTDAINTSFPQVSAEDYRMHPFFLVPKSNAFLIPKFTATSRHIPTSRSSPSGFTPLSPTAVTSTNAANTSAEDVQSGSNSALPR